MPAGAARNAVDCALWDLDAKRSGIRAHVTAGLTRWPPATTAYTISLDTPEGHGGGRREGGRAADPQGEVRRARTAISSASRPSAAPPREATLIADANEGWTEANLEAHLAACAEAGYALVEQPLPAKADGYPRPDLAPGSDPAPTRACTTGRASTGWSASTTWSTSSSTRPAA